MEKDTYRWRFFYSYYQFCNEFYQQMNITSFLHHCLLLPSKKILFNSSSKLIFFLVCSLQTWINDSPKKEAAQTLLFLTKFYCFLSKKNPSLHFMFYKFSYNFKIRNNAYWISQFYYYYYKHSVLPQIKTLQLFIT